MQVRSKSIPAVEITLLADDARELAHILTMYVIEAQAGTLGSGTSIDNQIKLAESLAADIKERTQI